MQFARLDPYVVVAATATWIRTLYGLLRPALLEGYAATIA